MNRFVIAEPNKCIGCRTCEVACVMAHQSGEEEMTLQSFQPRLTVVRNGKVTTPILCRHCDDAPCAKACPVNAIVFSHDSVQVMQELCLGCKTCVVACPYGAMNIVQVPAEPMPGTFVSHRMKSEAQKCDLCIGRAEGPACVTVCPTKALHLVDRKVMASTLRKRQEQAALDLASGAKF
ncbi:MAG: 4Fe-4S dicluster domain-containing protein [Formivibrio sp.]|nr:4Fe-4S dicluster domain-containing protein [Formivibrio sp.]